MKKTSKKAQGLPLEVVIIAAVALIVAVVLAFIFRGESNKFMKSTSCAAKEGVCLHTLGGEDCPEIKVYTSDCKEMEKNRDTGKYEAKKVNDKEVSPGQCCIALT